MARANQLYAHYAALRTDALLDAAVKGYRPWGELHVKAFWERYPKCERDPRRLMIFTPSVGSSPRLSPLWLA